MKLIIDHITHKYNTGTSMEVCALNDISMVINEGDFIGIIGHTGSGKSTLVQMLNGLIKPTEGTVYYDGEDIFDKSYDRKLLRAKVGLVFQYSEHQLFAETVFEDVCFGPRNMGLSRKESELRAFEALKTVGMEDEYFYQSPFDLSGGQKRRAAIAGVLAMKPEVLVLDEPTAGLDPQSRDELLDKISEFHAKKNVTVILVSHSMEDIARYTKRLIVVDKGKIAFDDTPANVFAHYEELESMGLRAPEVTYIMQELRKSGYDIPTDIITIPEAAAVLKQTLFGDMK